MGNVVDYRAIQCYCSREYNFTLKGTLLMDRRVRLPLRTIGVLREFTIRPYCTQPELQDALGISPPTVFRAVEQLRELGILKDGDGIPSEARGRPPTSLELQPNSLCIISMVIRTDQSWIYLVDEHGQVRYSETIKVSGDDPYERALHQYTEKIEKVASIARNDFAVTAGVGVSFGGSVDPQTGLLTKPSRFPDWHDRPLAKDLSGRTGFPCKVDNDTIALARAVLWFSPADLPSSFLLLSIDFGLGVGLCMDGHIYTGEHRRVSAGLAHTTAFGWSDKKCHCGRIVCLETVLSIPGVIRQARETGVTLEDTENPRSIKPIEILERLAKDGQESAREVLVKTAQRLGVVGWTVARVLDLPMIVFAGGLIASSDVFWEGLQEELERQGGYSEERLIEKRLRDVVRSSYPEALAAAAVALDGLYQSRELIVFEKSGASVAGS
jgi:predicted NBD/HSP70 family sugar kinase